MKKKIIFGLIIIALILGLGFVRAAYTDNLLISGKNNDNKEVVDNDVFEGNDEITSSSKTINGNQFLAGNKLTIEDEVINGDVYLAGNQIRIKDDVVVNGNVFVAGSNIEIEGRIERDLYAMGQYVLVDEDAVIGYAAYIGGDEVEIKGTINRDLNIGGNDISVKDTASILGDLNYSSTNEGNISEKAVEGKINFDKQVVRTKTTTEIAMDYCMSLLRNIVFVLFIFIFALLVFPRFVKYSKEYVGLKLFKSFGIGLASIIILPIWAIFLIILNVTMNLGLFLIPVYIVALAVAESAFIISIASKINEKYSKIKLPVWVLLMTLVIWLIKQIPVVGGIAVLFIMLSGFGIIIQSLFRKKQISE